MLSLHLYSSTLNIELLLPATPIIIRQFISSIHTLPFLTNKASPFSPQQNVIREQAPVIRFSTPLFPKKKKNTQNTIPSVFVFRDFEKPSLLTAAADRG